MSKYFQYWEQQIFLYFFLESLVSLNSLFFNLSPQLPDGQILPLPSVILGELGKDPQNPTVCFYGHVDVQPAKKEDGWSTDPYTLTEINGVHLFISFVWLFEYMTEILSGTRVPVYLTKAWGLLLWKSLGHVQQLSALMIFLRLVGPISDCLIFGVEKQREIKDAL